MTDLYRNHYALNDLISNLITHGSSFDEPLISRACKVLAINRTIKPTLPIANNIKVVVDNYQTDYLKALTPNGK